MKKVLSLVMILILSLTACGGKGGGASDDPNLGKYIGVEYSGDGSNWFSLSEIFDEGESYIELKDGGKGVFCLGGDATDIKWKMCIRDRREERVPKHRQALYLRRRGPQGSAHLLL